MTSLDGKVAVITGASSGIGAHLAKTLAEQGMHVVLLARREDRLRDVAEAITNAGGQASWKLLDVTDLAAFQAVATAIIEEHGRVDVLVNNAGFGNKRTFLDEPYDGIEGMLQVNYLGAVYGMKLFLDKMKQQGAGHIVNVASVAGEYFNPLMGAYCASKAALVSLSTATAAELRGTGVTVSVLNPGPIDTEFFTNETWAAYQPHHPDWMITPVEEVGKGLLRILETKRFKLFVPGWFALMVWTFNFLGPVANWIVALKRMIVK